ncbi:MAG TPA: hypothetical protein EYO74_05690 [Piscirickettsiaceae bacterium]|nr:hypothetical protein [Piscirickettsiaceae bacterium]
MSLKKLSLSMMMFVPIASAQMHHANMDHAAMMGHNQPIAQVREVMLTESGTDPFATLQEVIAALEVNPNTSWEKVNLEALRLHLIEMQDMTINVEVSQQSITNGFKAVVTPTTPRAAKSLKRVLSGHPSQMKAETGWDMQVENINNVFTLTVTTPTPGEVAKIRGLGYIGLMAYGNHHQPHHWAIATGNNPHAGHNMKH